MIGVSFPGMIKKAEELGATHIIAVDCRLLKREPIPHIQTPVTYITNAHMKVGHLTKDAAKLSYAFALGYANAVSNKDLQKLLA